MLQREVFKINRFEIKSINFLNEVVQLLRPCFQKVEWNVILEAKLREKVRTKVGRQRTALLKERVIEKGVMPGEFCLRTARAAVEEPDETDNDFQRANKLFNEFSHEEQMRLLGKLLKTLDICRFLELCHEATGRLLETVREEQRRRNNHADEWTNQRLLGGLARDGKEAFGHRD